MTRKNEVLKALAQAIEQIAQSKIKNETGPLTIPLWNATITITFNNRKKHPPRNE